MHVLTAQLALGIIAASSANAVTVLIDSGGFESPLNSPGGLTGQDVLLDDGLGLSTWLTTGGPSTAVVQSDIVQGGTQALRVDRAANSDQRWAVVASSPPGAPKVFVDWHMRISTPASFPGGFGPFFGVEVYDDSAGIALLGSFGVDAATREILYQTAVTGFFNVTGDTVDYDEWNHFQLALDFDADAYEIRLNGSLLHTEGFVDGAAGKLSDVNISALAAAGDATSQALEGTAHFDNFAVSVPEPSAALFAALGLGSLFSRRRQSC